MCATCKKLPTMTSDQGLKTIGEAIKKGADPEHFKAALDKLLGTIEPEQDAERDEAWERSHRRQT